MTDVKIENALATDQSNVPVTFGHVFAVGHVTRTETLVGVLGDGTTIPLQVNVKATHPDGSVRHAIVSAVVPRLALNQTQTIQLIKTAATTAQPAAAPTDLTGAGFTASATITIGGIAYTASADKLLRDGKYTSWLSGPIANEWLLSAPLVNAQGVEHPHLRVRFAIRSFTGLNKAKVDVTVENAWAYEAGPQNLTYDVNVAVGGNSAYAKTGLTHYHHTRWRKSFWWGGAAETHVRHNSAYLMASKAVPNYDRSLTIPASVLTTLKSQFSGQAAEPMGTGLALPYMPTTGGRPDIGLLPGWAVMYLLSMDKDAKTATMGTADLAGSFSTHYRDKATDRPVSLLNYPYMTILGQPSNTLNPVTQKMEAFPACGGNCTTPNEADAAHQPSFAYLPYLVTGDYYYLEELQFWAMWNLFRLNPAYRENVKGLLYEGELRGQAWSLRSLSEAAYITPDNDAFKSQFTTFLSDNLDWYNNAFTNNPSPNNALGAMTSGYAFAYENGTAIAPWQDDFFTAAVGRAMELGYAKAQPLLLWKAKFPVGRIADPGFCWIVGSSYNLKLRDSATGPIYTSMAKVYQASYPALTSMTCNSPAMASNLGLSVGEMVYYAYSPIGHPANMQPALAYSADAGAPNAANAWKIFTSATVRPNYSTGPQFAIVPR